MATDSGYRAFGFSLGEVLNQGLTAITDNPAVTLGIAFVFGAIPNFVFSWMAMQLRVNPFSAGAGLAFGALLFVAAVVGGLCALIGQAALMRVAASHRAGLAVGFGEAIGGALRVAGPLLLLIIIMTLSLTIAFVLLVVPGIILSIMWAVAMPALVIERAGVVEALGRSRHLTKGARWKIFGGALLLALILAFVSGIVAVVGGIVGGLTNSPLLLGMLPSALLQTLTTAYVSTVLAALFLELRDWKEGPETDALSEIFA